MDRKIFDETWYVEEAPGYPQTCMSFLYCFHNSNKKWGVSYDYSFIFTKEDHFYELTPLSGKDNICGMRLVPDRRNHDKGKLGITSEIAP